VFLSEAFTRPTVMRYLAKAGFTQSYTYFTWRHTKEELTEYLTELTATDVREVGADALRTEHDRPVIKIILGHTLHHAGTAAPAAFDIGAETLGPHLFGVAGGLIAAAFLKPQARTVIISRA